MAFMVFLLCHGCSSAPWETIQAAEMAISRAKGEATSPDCLEMIQSAETHLSEAKVALEAKNYERAKTEAFESLRFSNDARDCGGEN